QIAGTSYQTTAAGDGDYKTPANVSVSLGAGTYHWVVSLTSDDNNNAPADRTDKPFTAGPSPPKLTTTILAPTRPVPARSITVQDQASIKGRCNHPGPLSFPTRRSSDLQIAGTSYQTTAAGDGDYKTPANVSVSLGAGTYHWVVSLTSDDNNNAP